MLLDTLRTWLCNGRACLCCDGVDKQKRVGVIDETFAADGREEEAFLGGPTREFDVFLVHDSNTKLGLSINRNSDGMLRVADVLGGDTSIGLWNMEHPKNAVQKNDLIVSVDARNKEGQTDCGHMLLKIRKPVLRTVMLSL